MKLRNVLFAVLLLITMNSVAQTKIETKDGTHYLTTTIGYPVTGTYLFENAEPTVELNTNGTGFYQLHEQLKKAVIWGIECNELGEPKFKKGFDNAAYSLWYQYSNAEADTDKEWKTVEFSIHFNTLKMYIQGERIKDYTDSVEK